MSEAELLELATEGRANLAFIVTQTVAIQFAVLAGLFYFLWRQNFMVRFLIFVLYSVGYGSMLGLYFWETSQFGGVALSLLDLPSLSPAGKALLDWSRNMGAIQSISAACLFFAGWILMGVAFFFNVFRHAHESGQRS